jgi:hypothetical protein
VLVNVALVPMPHSVSHFGKEVFETSAWIQLP